MKLQKELYHFNKWLNPEKCEAIPSEVFCGLSMARMVEFLLAQGAPAICVFMDASRGFTRCDLNSRLLHDPFSFVGVISAVPGRLAFYLGEYHDEARVMRS